METNILLKPTKRKSSVLDKAYSKHIDAILKNINDEEEGRWEIYGAIIQQLIDDGKESYYKEIKYRLSDGENPNKVMLDIIERESDSIDGLLFFFKKRIEEYLEEDFFKKFH